MHCSLFCSWLVKEVEYLSELLMILSHYVAEYQWKFQGGERSLFSLDTVIWSFTADVQIALTISAIKLHYGCWKHLDIMWHCQYIQRKTTFNKSDPSRVKNEESRVRIFSKPMEFGCSFAIFQPQKVAWKQGTWEMWGMKIQSWTIEENPQFFVFEMSNCDLMISAYHPPSSRRASHTRIRPYLNILPNDA